VTLLLHNKKVKIYKLIKKNDIKIVVNEMFHVA